MKKFTFVDLFSGIGGFRLALEKAGGQCLAFSEINKSAIKIYKKNFDTENEIELGDISKTNNFISADLVVGGVPCQAWSVAGKKLGFDDPRGKLWFDTINYVSKTKPKAFIFENVKGLQDPRNKDSLDLIIESLRKENYNVSYKLLNSLNFGSVQKRERIFIVGVRKDIKKDFMFPEGTVNSKTLSDFFYNKKSKSKENKFFIFSDIRDGQNTIHSWDIVKTSKKEQETCLALLKNRRKSKYGPKDGNPLSLHSLTEINPKITSKEIDSLINKKILREINGKYDFVNSKQSTGINGIYRIFLKSCKEYPTLTSSGSNDFLASEDFSGNKECFIEKIFYSKKYEKINIEHMKKLQGFPSNFKNGSIGESIKQFGNAVPVMVIDSLIESLITVFE